MYTTIRKYILLSIALCIGMTTYGQSQSQARKWFSEGNYEKAKPVFARLVKNNPRSGSMNYWYGVCLNETGEHDKALPYLKKAVDSKVENAFRYIGDYYLSDGDYEMAIEHYDIYLDYVDPTDTMFVKYTRQAERAKHEQRFMKRVEKVIFVDSIVVQKDKFLTAYGFGSECGTVTSTRRLMKGESDEGYAYRTDMRDKIYYSDVDGDGVMQLYMSYKMLDEWSKPILLEGLPEGDKNYPYVLSDGVTIYFANDNAAGLGGYDIYVTRYNTSTDRYLLAENIGMPFNSEANDYMMVIDEINNLGWFATDRNQADSMVCIYTFIPNEVKQYYDYNTEDRKALLQASRIQSIAATQTDEEALKLAQQRLFKLTLNAIKEQDDEDFVFIIDDFTDYHSLDDFKNPEARQLYIDWENQKKNLKNQYQQLEDMRIRYTQSSASERKQLSKELLQMEQQYEALESQVLIMDRMIRNKEIEYSNN